MILQMLHDLVLSGMGYAMGVVTGVVLERVRSRA